MKQYYFNDYISFRYPEDLSEYVNDWGVLSKYKDKLFTREEMDDIICEMVKRHPYVPHGLTVKIKTLWINEEGEKGYYHILYFTNDDCYEQVKEDVSVIKYEK